MLYIVVSCKTSMSHICLSNLGYGTPSKLLISPFKHVDLFRHSGDEIGALPPKWKS